MRCTIIRGKCVNTIRVARNIIDGKYDQYSHYATYYLICNILLNVIAVIIILLDRSIIKSYWIILIAIISTSHSKI